MRVLDPLEQFVDDVVYGVGECRVLWPTVRSPATDLIENLTNRKLTRSELVRSSTARSEVWPDRYQFHIETQVAFANGGIDDLPLAL